MPEFTVYLKSTATIGVLVTADSADEAEAIAERDHYGPKTAGTVDFGTWDVATGETEPYGAEPRATDWVPQHIEAKRHAQWNRTRRALSGITPTTEETTTDER